MTRPQSQVPFLLLLSLFVLACGSSSPGPVDEDAGVVDGSVSCIEGGDSVSETDLGYGVSAVVWDGQATAFAALGTGGLWRSRDGGRSWQPTGDLPTPLTEELLDLLFKNGVLYASVHGQGIWASTDAGETFLPVSESLPTVASRCQSMWIGAESWVVGARDEGLHVSHDSGATWSPSEGEGALFARDITAYEQRLYVADYRVFASDDQGATWSLAGDDAPARVYSLAIGTRLWSGGTNGLSSLRNGTWTAHWGNPPAPVTAIVEHGQRLWMTAGNEVLPSSTTGGLFHTSVDAIATPQPVTIPEVSEKHLTALAISDDALLVGRLDGFIVRIPLSCVP